MNNSIFSPKRFKNLFIRDLFVNLKPLTTIVGGIFSVLLVIFIILVLKGDTENILVFKGYEKFYKKTFYIVFIVGTLLVSGNAFRDFRNKERKMHYLMLPSSTLEKILSQYVLTIFVFSILVTIIYCLFSALCILLVNYYTAFTMEFYNPFSEIHWGSFFRVFIPLQLILLAGAVTFNKVPLFYTGLFTIIYYFVVFLILYGFGYLLFSGESDITTVISTIFHNKPITPSFNIGANKPISLKVFYYFGQYLLGILSVIYIWFKVKEKEA